MKKILLSTIVLTAFAMSTILFQISCKKDAVADTTTPAVTQQSKLLFTKDDASIWIANYDGSNPQNLNVVLPSGLGIDGSLSLSPDHKTIFFSVFYKVGSQLDDIYSCSIDGTNVKKVITGSYQALPF